MKYCILLIVITFILVGCQATQPEMTTRSILDWQYSDLRLLDPSDTIMPQNDLIAAYARINGQSFQMRIDFLASGMLPANDIYIAVDTNPGGRMQIFTKNNLVLSTKIAWDYLIKIPASGKVEFINDRLTSVYGTSLFIVRDRTLDSIIVSFNQSTLPITLGKTHIQVLVTAADENILVDQSEPFSIDAPSPARIKVLFAFWNTFTAKTPAQALRSWAGAHSGPMRSRHGLRYLLDAAEQTQTGVALMDLATPDTLSVLDYLEVLQIIKNMEKFGYIDICNNNDGFILLKCLLFNSFSVNDYAHLINYCPLYPNNSVNFDVTSSFSVDCKKFFLRLAIDQPTLPILLGGDFSKSILGVPSIGLEVFSYIKAHPWIQVISLNEYQLLSGIGHLSNNDQSTEPNLQYSEEDPAQLQGIQLKIYQEIKQLPENQISELARRVFSNLSVSAQASPNLALLRSNYVGQIGEIISAAQWASNPTLISTCESDLDYGGSNECILANMNIFVVIEPEGGMVPFVFTKDDQGVHQVIGPTWEFIVGLSDPSTWDLSSGVRSDGDQILGALSDSLANWNKYKYILGDNNIDLYDDTMSIRKKVNLSTNSVEIEVHNQDALSAQAYIPLVLDPWIRDTPGWGALYESNATSNTFSWKFGTRISVQIDSSNQLYGFPFNATRSSLRFPEDPNFDYSKGHYLPFPMALVEINSSKDYSVRIIINPD